MFTSKNLPKRPFLESFVWRQGKTLGYFSTHRLSWTNCWPQGVHVEYFLELWNFLLIEGALKYVWYYMWHCSEMLSTRRFLLVSAVMFVLRRFVENVLINSIAFIPIPFYKQIIKQPWVLPMFTLLKHILLKLTELWLVIPPTVKNPCKILKWILNPMLEYVYVLV